MAWPRDLAAKGARGWSSSTPPCLDGGDAIPGLWARAKHTSIISHGCKKRSVVCGRRRARGQTKSRAVRCAGTRARGRGAGRGSGAAARTCACAWLRAVEGSRHSWWAVFRGRGLPPPTPPQRRPSATNIAWCWWRAHPGGRAEQYAHAAPLPAGRSGVHAGRQHRAPRSAAHAAAHWRRGGQAAAAAAAAENPRPTLPANRSAERQRAAGRRPAAAGAWNSGGDGACLTLRGPAASTCAVRAIRQRRRGRSQAAAPRDAWCGHRGRRGRGAAARAPTQRASMGSMPGRAHCGAQPSTDRGRWSNQQQQRQQQQQQQQRQCAPPPQWAPEHRRLEWSLPRRRRASARAARGAALAATRGDATPRALARGAALRAGPRQRRRVGDRLAASHGLPVAMAALPAVLRRRREQGRRRRRRQRRQQE